MLKWKSQQCISSGKPDIFALPWVVDAIQRIHATQGEHFAGVLSVLYAGEQQVAAHLGMRSKNELHWWFPTYDPGFARYSPGLILLLAMAEHATSLGIHRIDLGKGRAHYKERLANRSVPLAEGVVTASLARTITGSLRRRAKLWLRRSPLGVPVRKLKSFLRRGRNQPNAE